MTTANNKLNLEFLKSKRKDKGITIAQMAEALSLKSPSNYYKYESGEYSLRADMLPVIASVLGCKEQDFFYNGDL